MSQDLPYQNLPNLSTLSDDTPHYLEEEKFPVEERTHTETQPPSEPDAIEPMHEEEKLPFLSPILESKKKYTEATISNNSHMLALSAQHYTGDPSARTTSALTFDKLLELIQESQPGEELKLMLQFELGAMPFNQKECESFIDQLQHNIKGKIELSFFELEPNTDDQLSNPLVFAYDTIEKFRAEGFYPEKPIEKNDPHFKQALRLTEVIAKNPYFNNCRVINDVMYKLLADTKYASPLGRTLLITFQTLMKDLDQDQDSSVYKRIAFAYNVVDTFPKKLQFEDSIFNEALQIAQHALLPPSSDESKNSDDNGTHRFFHHSLEKYSGVEMIDEVISMLQQHKM